MRQDKNVVGQFVFLSNNPQAKALKCDKCSASVRHDMWLSLVLCSSMLMGSRGYIECSLGDEVVGVGYTPSSIACWPLTG